MFQQRPDYFDALCGQVAAELRTQFDHLGMRCVGSKPHGFVQDWVVSPFLALASAPDSSSHLMTSELRPFVSA